MTDLLLFVGGLVVGAMNAIAGGGMLIGFPILLATGLPALTANATANIVVLPGNISSTFGYRKYLRRVPRSYLLLLIPAAIGAAIGSTTLRHTSFTQFQQLIPALILFAVALFAFQPLLYNFIHRQLHGPKRNRGTWQSLFMVAAAVLPLSVYGGYFGAGFGFIMLAFLGFTRLHDHIHRMNALKTTITVCIASVSLACLFSSHLIDWRKGLVMGAGCLVGGYFGARWTQSISGHAIRIFIVVIGLVTTAWLGLRSY